VNRPKPEIVVVADEGALAQLVASRFIEAAKTAIAERGVFTVALAGGSTPKAAYALLARQCCDAIDWNHVRFYFGDERCVPPDDERSNYKMANDAMLKPLYIDAHRIFRMHGEDDPQIAAAAYRGVLQAELGDEPVLDLVMLGMGPDGHTASLFPGTDPLDGDALLVKAPYVAQMSGFRLTLTPRLINAARRVEIATAGDAKAEALADVLEGALDPVRRPVQIVAPTSGKLAWLVDHAAAARLRSGEHR